jgi:hypothetical protein
MGIVNKTFRQIEILDKTSSKLIAKGDLQITANLTKLSDAERSEILKATLSFDKPHLELSGQTLMLKLPSITGAAFLNQLPISDLELPGLKLDVNFQGNEWFSNVDWLNS